MKQIRILIVDDHAVVRLGLAALFKYQKDLKVVGEADDGETAITKATDLKPDVVILDLMMPGIGATETTKRLRETVPSANVLVFTSFGTSGELANVLKAGAVGAILKGAPNEELLAAIRKAAIGERVLSRKIEESIRESPVTPEFTKRQAEILESVTRGFSNPAIAKQLGISTDAVKQHLNAIYQKLDVSTRTEAITAALRRQRHLAPANGRFSVPTVFEADPDNETFLTLTLDIEEGRYSGLQVDLAVPAALELFDIDTQPDFGALTRKLVEYTTDGDTPRYYRLLLYADGSHALAPGRHNLNLQFLTGSRDTSVHPVSIFAALLSTDQGEQERLAPLSSLFTFTPDPLEGIGGQLTAGKTSPFGGSEGDPTYDLTGRPVRTSPLGGSEEGHSRGVFLQNSHKILY